MFHVCFDLFVVYGVGICVDACGGVCVVECCLFLASEWCWLSFGVWSVVIRVIVCVSLPFCLVEVSALNICSVLRAFVSVFWIKSEF